MKIGAQLYSVHNFTKTPEGFSEALKKVADIGYTSVQVSGTCAYEPEWLAEQLKSCGLTCDLTHFSLDRVCENPEKVVAEHKVYGCKYIGLGSMPGMGGANTTHETIVSFVEKLRPITERITAAGGYYMYHNHDAEFKKYDGELAMDTLANGIAPENMGFTLDTHWIKVGGYDPVEWFKKLAGRIPCVHYKDLVTMPNGSKRFAPVGIGELDFPAIIQASLDLGVEYAFVEQDDCYGEDPYLCLKKSYDYLKSMGLN